MSTSGSFTPAGTPPCPAPMTRAALLALRAAGQLRLECHYVITDGPVIGTAGNTSPTTIELHAVSTTELAMEAKVHTTFHTSAWNGIYDVDLGPAGSIQRLTDEWNNTAQDANTSAPTVHSQVPWHLAGPTFRDNFWDVATLPGWSGLGGSTVRDNVVLESTVDLTGKTAGTFNQNQITGSSLTAVVPTSFIAGNQITQAVISHLGAGAGSFSFQNNLMLTGQVSVDATTTGQVTMNNNVVGGTAGGYRVVVTGKTGTPTIISGNRLFNPGGGAQDLLVAGGGSVNVTSSDINGGNIVLNGPANADVDGSDLTATSITAGPGVLAATGVQASGAVVTHGGTGVLTMTNAYMNGGSVVTAGASTRGLTLNQVEEAGSTVTQNGTGSANVDTLSLSQITGSAVNLNSTLVGTPAQLFTRLTVTGNAVVNVVNPGTATPMDGSTVQNGATLNVQAGSTFLNSRVGSQATLNLGSFAHVGSVFEAFATKTSTGNNTGRLVNKAFDDWQ